MGPALQPDEQLLCATLTEKKSGRSNLQLPYRDSRPFVGRHDILQFLLPCDKGVCMRDERTSGQGSVSLYVCRKSWRPALNSAAGKKHSSGCRWSPRLIVYGGLLYARAFSEISLLLEHCIRTARYRGEILSLRCCVSGSYVSVLLSQRAAGGPQKYQFLGEKHSEVKRIILASGKIARDVVYFVTEGWQSGRLRLS